MFNDSPHPPAPSPLGEGEPRGNYQSAVTSEQLLIVHYVWLSLSRREGGRGVG